MGLLEELNLDPKDIRSHAWYHGSISRDESQQIVLDNGQFLVRDDQSNPRNYVLTCKHDDKVLHFRINKVTNFKIKRSLTLKIIIRARLEDK